MKMDSASLQFIAFGVAVAFISNIHRSAAWRCIVLFVASIGFLHMLAHNVILLIPLASFLLLGYLAIVLIDRGWLRLLSGAVIAVILVYVWLKKYTFLPQGIFLHYPYFTLGLSYIFFRVLHLIIETGEGNERRHISLGAYLLYMLNFTTFISGPIQRYDEFARDQFAADPISLGPRVIGSQLERIVRGFVKVNVVAMLFNMVHVNALAQMSQPCRCRSSSWQHVGWPLFIRSSSTAISPATSTSSLPWRASCACACRKTSTGHSPLRR